MAIRWDKFTVKSQEAVQAATNLALEHGNPELTPMHMLAALLEDREGIIVPVLQKVGVPTEQLLSRANDALNKLPKVGGSSSQPGLSNAMQKVLEQAFKEAANFKDEYVSTEHLLLALAEQKGDPARELLASLGATHDAILQALTACAAIAARHRPESRRQSSRRSKSTPRTSPNWRAAASSTRSSGATRRFAASCRC